MIRRASPAFQFWLGNTAWSLLGDWRRVLFDDKGLRLDQWRSDGQATLIKRGPGRTIYRVRLPELDLFVKRFRAVGLFSKLHQMVRPDRAHKEYLLAQRLSAWGVTTIRPIAYGERRHLGVLRESYVLTEAIPRGITLFELIERCFLTGREECPLSLRIFFAHELAKLAATIHDAGIEHRDLHERNIIVQPPTHSPALPGRAKPYNLFLLDLHEMRLHGKLRWNTACNELARTGRYFTLRSTRTDRLRFFFRYAQLRGIPREEVRRLAREVEARTMESRADFWRRRDARPEHKISWVDCYRRRGMVAYALNELPAQTVQELMADPEAPFHKVRRWWKIGRLTRVAEVDLPKILRGGRLVYKQYFFKGWHESLAALIHPNQATRAWKRGAALLLRELPTPRPLLLIHRLRFGLPVGSYLITERVPDAESVTTYLERHKRGSSPDEWKRIHAGVMRSAAELFRKMHDRRVTHRDLKASNILVSPTDDPADPKFWLVDLDSVQTWQQIPEHLRVQNLARFNVSFYQKPWVSRTDRLRFLRLYLGRDFQDRERWKSLWREIWKSTDKKVRRNTRLGRAVV